MKRNYCHIWIILTVNCFTYRTFRVTFHPLPNISTTAVNSWGTPWIYEVILFLKKMLFLLFLQLLLPWYKNSTQFHSNWMEICMVFHLVLWNIVDFFGVNYDRIPAQLLTVPLPSQFALLNKIENEITIEYFILKLIVL